MWPNRLLVPALLLVASCVVSGHVPAGNASTGDVEKMAEEGNAEAEVAWGRHLMDSRDAPTRAGSTAWFRKAALQGDHDGEWMLGSAYMSGIGVTRDEPTGLGWMRKSLVDGTPDHMATYGMTLLISARVSGQPNDGVEWLRRSVASGSTRGMMAMGMLQLSGNMGVPKDLPAAETLFQKAAQAGSPDAQAALGTLYLSDTLGKADIPQALHWLELAAKQGSADAQGTLGYMLISGDHGVPKRPAEGVDWANKAAAQNAAPGYYALGTAFLYGTGKDKDPAQAWYNFAIAARLDAKHQLTKAADRMSDAATQLKPDVLQALRAKVEGVPVPTPAS